MRYFKLEEDNPVDRAEEFIQLFNRVQQFLSQIVNPGGYTAFKKLVEIASTHNTAVQANAAALKQFAMLRNAIIHDSDYPKHIVAVPSPEALSKFKQIVQHVIEPTPLIPKFARQVRCFFFSEPLATVISYMREYDFSQVTVRDGNGKLGMVSVEGITWWLADNLKRNLFPSDTARLRDVMDLEPQDGFIIMGPDKTIYDAVDAFRNYIYGEASRLYAIVITKNGGNADDPIGLVTPWDLVHNSHLSQ